MKLKYNVNTEGLIYLNNYSNLLEYFYLTTPEKKQKKGYVYNTPLNYENALNLLNALNISFIENEGFLKSVVNQRRDKKTGEKFKLCLVYCLTKFNKTLSTKYIRSFIKNEDLSLKVIEKAKKNAVKKGIPEDYAINQERERQKTFKLIYLIKRSGLNKIKHLRFFDEWALNKYTTFKTEFRHNPNTLIYNDFPYYLLSDDLTEEQKNEKLNRRNAINKDGGVYLYKTEVLKDIGKEFIRHNLEVLNFIEVY